MTVDKNLAKEIGSYWESKGLFASTMMEECGELAQAISKVARARRQLEEAFEKEDDDTYDEDKALCDAESALEEEIADMYIVLKVLEVQWPIDIINVERKIEQKLEKVY